jgi:hypothetical protein
MVEPVKEALERVADAAGITHKRRWWILAFIGIWPILGPLLGGALSSAIQGVHFTERVVHAAEVVPTLEARSRQDSSELQEHKDILHDDSLHFDKIDTRISKTTEMIDSMCKYMTMKFSHIEEHSAAQDKNISINNTDVLNLRSYIKKHIKAQ